MQPFDFHLKTRVVFGTGSLDRLGELASEIGATRALVVSDPGIVAAGHVARGMESLTAAKIEVQLFGAAQENPTTDDVDGGMVIANQFRPDLLIGLGGGSSMDCAKGINFIYSCGGTMHDYHGVGKATADMLPMIAVPTTAGTGSEMQSFALISDAITHQKMACGDKRASCKIAILDPELTLTQPPMVAALTGIDAISHAIETYVTTQRNPVSMFYSRESWRLLAGNFLTVLENPNDIEARAAMQLGAAYAGVAIENSMLGASHALANPLTAEWGIAHGQAVGLMLPHVVRFNGIEWDEAYRELLTASEEGGVTPPASDGAEGISDFITRLLNATGLRTKLSELDVDQSRLPELAEQAATQWTASFNPRPVDARSLLKIYQSAY